jgi:uncharacterized lipoprotein YbaY
MKTIRHIVFSLFTIALVGCASSKPSSTEPVSTVSEKTTKVVTEEATESKVEYKENYNEAGTLIDRYFSGELSD